MKYVLSLVLFLSSASFSFGQTPSVKPAPSPAASPAQRRDFGSSLKKYGRKQRKDSQDKLKGNEPGDDEVIQVKTDLVVNDILVTNQKGNVITGLQKDDFVAVEDGVPQKIEMFSFGENTTLPRSIVLIIDCGVPQGPYLRKSIEAAKILVDKLAPQDKMAIVTDDVKIRVDFTADKTLLKKTLDSLDVNQGYNMEFDSLLATLNEMFDGENRQRIVIFQGDGVRVIWLKPDKDTPYPISYSTLDRRGLRYISGQHFPNYGFSDVREAIERSGATIYSVIPGIRFIGLSKEEQLSRARISTETTNKFYHWNKERDLPAIIDYYQYAEAEAKTAGQTAMFKVAELSGGFADLIEKPEDAESVYANIFTVIKNRYLIGYYPTNRQRDGKRREVRIEVRNHPEYTVTGRKAYYLSQ